MKTPLRFLTLITFCCCLASCFVPEKFTATLNVDKDQNYNFTYDGTIAFGPALGEIKQRGNLTAADEQKFKDSVDDLRKQEPGFKNIEYIGAGRYKVHYEDSGRVQDGKNIFLDLVEFRVASDGRIWILGAEITDQVRQQLSEVALNLDGQFKVTSDLNVVQNNAASTPYLGGLIGSYQWHISIDQKSRPTIVLQPSAVQSRVSEGTPNIAENKDFARLIVGSWQGDHNRTLCFAKDGSYRCDPGEVRGGWKIDGEKLLIAFTDGKSFNAPIVSLTDTTLVLAGRRHTDEYTRIKP